MPAKSEVRETTRPIHNTRIQFVYCRKEKDDAEKARQSEELSYLCAKEQQCCMHLPGAKCCDATAQATAYTDKQRGRPVSGKYETHSKEGKEGRKQNHRDQQKEER